MKYSFREKDMFAKEVMSDLKYAKGDRKEAADSLYKCTEKQMNIPYGMFIVYGAGEGNRTLNPHPETVEIARGCGKLIYSLG